MVSPEPSWNHRDHGFTLVELLAAILIVGILAAIAIPSFLSAVSGANDAAAEAMAGTARLAARSVALDNGGSFATVSRATLHGYDATIATKKAGTNAYLSAASGTVGAYTVTVTSTSTGNRFTINRFLDGTIARVCRIANRNAPHGGCEHVTGVNGRW